MDGNGYAPPASPPTCYRHPDRETWVRCVRCDRAICPDCMVEASVGFQCPECVRRGTRSQAITRTALGGRLRPQQTAVTYLLIAIHAVVFLLEQVSPRFELRYALIPGETGFAHPYAGVAGGEFYRLITAMFLHASVLHIVFNMWALLVVGAPLEALLGRLRFLVLYFLAGLGGSTAVYLFAPRGSATLGASGAIFGLFAALFVFGRRLNFDIRPIGLVIVINLALTFVLSGVSWQGHIGGLLSGGALAAAWSYAPRAWRTPAQLLSSIALLAILLIAVAIRTTQLTA